MMRRFCSKCMMLPCFTRSLVGSVGDITPLASSVPVFGSRRRRRIRDDDTSKKKEDKILNKPVPNETSMIDEDEAKSICFENYGFLQKPFFLNTWSEFLQELRRIEFRWSLVPLAGGTVVLSILEHNKEGEYILSKLKGSSSGCSPIAEFFECCAGFLEGKFHERAIKFINSDDTEFTMRVKANMRIPESNARDLSYEDPILPTLAQYNSQGISVEISLIDTKIGIEAPLLYNFSLQSFIYTFLTSIPSFLKRNDAGIRNIDFVSKEQMCHFRFAWCFLRREARMTAVEMGELDSLLPP